MLASVDLRQSPCTYEVGSCWLVLGTGEMEILRRVLRLDLGIKWIRLIPILALTTVAAALPVGYPADIGPDH